MSDYGLFESDEAAQAEPRLAAKTAGRKMEAAIDSVRRDFGRFLVASTGIDEFEDRWHLSKNDIRASVEPLVFPNTGTMRKIKNALKSDWKLAHPYKLSMDHDSAGFGSMPEGDGPPTNQHLDKTYHPSDGNLIPKADFEGWKNSVDQNGPEKVSENDFTPGGDSGSDRHARRRVARDPKNYDMVGHEYTNINDPVGSPEIMEDEGDHQGVHDYYRDMMEEPPAGYPRRDRSMFEDEKPLLEHPLSGTSGDLGSFAEEHDHDHLLARREAAALVADIYTDFARSNGLRVASLDTLDHYASTGIHESDYRLLQSMIIRAAEECEDDDDKEDSDDSDSESDSSDSESDSEAPEASESDDSDSDDDEDEEYDFGGESGSEADTDGDGDHDDDDHHTEEDDDDEEYDFGGGDQGGGEGGGQQYTVPEQAPDLEPQMLNEIPHDDTDGSAPVPPEVVDSLLGLPPGTIEQLLLEEVQQGQGGGDPSQGMDPSQGGGFGGPEQGAPGAGGDDFLGGGGGDPEQDPQRMAALRRFARLHQAKECNCWDGYCRVPGTKPCAEGSCEKCDTGRKKESRRRVAKDYGRKCSECKSNNTDYSSSTNDYDCWDCGATFKPYSNSNSKKNTEKESRRRQARQFWAAPDESEDELTERQKRDQKDSLDTQHESWMKSKSAARRFWAADGDQEPAEDSAGGGDPAGGEQPPQGDPAQGGGDPAAMGGQPMMPPPGSASVTPPAPPAPLENQPAEDALLDTANQAIMQMIDQETAEYQQIIAPLSQALQAVQMAQQVEQTEHPMDVTPPDGTVNVDPSQAPGGAQNPQQQLAKLMRQARIDQRQAKKVRVLKNAAHLIARTYGVSERMLLAAMGRRHYEHLAEAFQILPPEAHQTPEVRAAARHVGNMLAAENPMFNFGTWMESTVGGGMARAASNPRDRAGDAWRDGRDRGIAEHGRQDADDYDDDGPLIGSSEHWQGYGDQGHPESSSVPWSERNRIRGSRLPFDRPRLAGETWKNTSTMDRFEFPNEQPEITDNMTINDLPKQAPKGLPKMRHAVDLGTKVQRWLQKQTDSGLNTGGDAMAERYLTEHKNPSSQKGVDEVHQALGATPHAPEPKATLPKARVPRAVNPTTKKGSWGEWEPTKQASFFTRRVPGWKWDDHLSGYLSKEARSFTCACGESVGSPSYQTCRCGKIWNVYAIGDTHHLASDTASMYIAREIPVRDNVIMANRKLAEVAPGEPSREAHWGNYQKFVANDCNRCGAKPYQGCSPQCPSFKAFKVVKKNLADQGLADDSWDDSGAGIEYRRRDLNASRSHAEMLAMIDKLADWTKYDSPDPINDMGKSKPPPTSVAKPPKDWATRLPKGDPSKKGGTWTPPTIPRKKK